MKIAGFTLIELMVVMAIIAFFSMISVPNFLKFVSKAKRTEAYVNLGSLYIAQKAYYAEHGKYSPILSGSQGIGWQPEGYMGRAQQERFNYTYGFNGQEGQHHFTGKLETSATFLENTYANNNSFLAGAVGDIDGDGTPDVLTVNEYNDIKIKNDDLA